ncbi:MAG: pyridoxamine 5'-phosphate oxidase family protein [Anaerolineae bacterium]|nr:pyridoxamine 5'-phosphate oxidase family protein [Anaerolineae bacterium]
MVNLPEEVINAWDNRDGAVVLTTVAQDGTPNSIFVTCVSKYDNQTLIIADNYFNKTRANIHSGTRVSVLFITPEKKSYQIKGSMSYYTEGKYYNNMKEWNPKKHPGNAALVINIEEVYSGSQKLI